MKETHDYIHRYRGYWSDGGRCRIRIYREEGHSPVVVCSQLPDNDNTSVTNMAEYLAAEVIQEHKLPSFLSWIEHYPEHAAEIGEYSLMTFSDWELEEVCLGGIWRYRIGVPSWSHLRPEEVEVLLRDRRANNVFPRAWSCPGDDHGASRRYKAVAGRASPYGPDAYCIPVEANLRALHALYTESSGRQLAGALGNRRPRPLLALRTSAG